MTDAGDHGTIAPRSIGGILSAAVALYARHFWTFVATAAVIGVPLTLGQFWARDRLLPVRASSAPDDNAAFALLVLAVLSMLVSELMVGAMTHAIARAVAGVRPRVGESYRFALERIWTIIWVAVLVGLLVFAGLILLIVPGIILWVRLSVALPAVVVEGPRGGSALRRSFSLTRFNSWRVGGFLALMMIISGILGTLLDAFDVIGSVLGGMVLLPFMSIVIVLLYIDLRARGDGITVEQLRADLEAAS